MSKHEDSHFGDIATYYALRSEKDQAFRYLERAYQGYDSWIFEIQHPAFDSLRDDPRWLAFLRRLNLQDTPMAKLPAVPAPAARCTPKATWPYNGHIGKWFLPFPDSD